MRLDKGVLLSLVTCCIVFGCQSREQRDVEAHAVPQHVNVGDTNTVTKEVVDTPANVSIDEILEKQIVTKWMENPPISFKGSTFSFLNDDLFAIAEKNDTIYLPQGIYTYPFALKGRYNLTLIAPDGPAYFLVPDSDVDIFTIDSCQNLYLENIYFKHDVLYGTCMDASAVKLRYSSYIRLKHCLLNGSGTYGLNVEHSSGVEVSNSIIENCSRYAIRIDESDKVLFTNNVLHSHNLLAMTEPTINPMSFYTESLPRKEYVQYQMQSLNEFHVAFYGNFMRLGGYHSSRTKWPEPIMLRGTHFVEYNLIEAQGRDLGDLKISGTNQRVKRATETDELIGLCNWHPGFSFIDAKAQQLIGIPVIDSSVLAFNLSNLWGEPHQNSIEILFPGDYYSSYSEPKDIDGQSRMTVSNTSIMKSKIRFFENGETEHMEGVFKRKTLAASDSCLFIIDSGAVEPGSLPKVFWKSTEEAHQIVQGDYQCTIQTHLTNAISYVLLIDKFGERILAYRNVGIQGDYGPYGQMRMSWVGDLNRDGRPDFMCDYEAGYCQHSHLLFLSNGALSTGYEVNFYPDIKDEPCGC